MDINYLEFPMMKWNKLKEKKDDLSSCCVTDEENQLKIND